jgi:penicillin amidase/acyl-homoserine-lactone acylase
MVIIFNKIFLLILTILVIGNNYDIDSIFNNKNSPKRYKKYDVTIYRDTWGVPHIFGNKDEDAAYGLGYAHAEDDFITIQDILVAARGDLAKHYGKQMAANDYMVQLLKIWDVVEKNYQNGLSEDVIKISEAYADGINHYVSLYPNMALKGVFPVTGKDIVAGFIHRMPLMFGLDGILGDLASNQYVNNSKKIPTTNSTMINNRMLGSNVIAISRKVRGQIH